MNRWMCGVAAACLLSAAYGAEAATGVSAAAVESSDASAAPSAASEALWRSEIEAWANDQIDPENEALNPEYTNVFFGDFTGDGVPDAFLHAVVMGRTYTSIRTALFRNEGGHMRLARDVDDVYGAMPENVRFSRGQVTLTTTFMDGPEAGQTENWTIRVAP